MEKTASSNIYVDYLEKINSKTQLTGVNSTDINELIVFLNFCFNKKNNFFIENFNVKSIKSVYLFYNQLKTNILTPDIKDIFNEISSDKFKLIKFIVIRNINNYQIIEETELCSHISKESLQRILNYLHSLGI